MAYFIVCYQKKNDSNLIDKSRHVFVIKNESNCNSITLHGFMASDVLIYDFSFDIPLRSPHSLAL
jgi:hypothetical protein